MLVRDVIDDVKQVIGQCSQELALQRLSDAITILANKSEIDGIIGYADICTTTDGCMVSLPREVETPMAVNVCGQPMMFRNKWYEFHLNGDGSFRQVPWAWDDYGRWPVAMDIITAGVLIAVADLKTDLGATVRVYGWDRNGVWIRTQNEDGVWQDGFLVPINLVSDYPGNIITPDYNRIIRRRFYGIPSTDFTSVAAHSFATGEPVVLSYIPPQPPPTLPTPLVATRTYWIRRIDANTVRLYATQADALADYDPISISSDPTGSDQRLTDSRAVATETKFVTSTVNKIKTGNLVSIDGAPIPTPLSATDGYYARVLSDTEFRIYNSENDADNDENPINCTDVGAGVTVGNNIQVWPNTTLVFSVGHNLVTGDKVRFYNAGGALPFPLVPSTDYYVRVIDENTLTVHSSLANAGSGAEPTVITDTGSGTSSLQKVLNAAVSLGSKNNITVANHNLTAGDYVQFQTSGILPSPLAGGTVYQVQNPLSSGTFSLAELTYDEQATTYRRRTIAPNTNRLYFGLTDPGYITSDVVDVEGVGGTAYNAVQAVVTATGTADPGDGNMHYYIEYASTSGVAEGNTADTSGRVYKGRVNITTSGGGALELVISRAFVIGFDNTWRTDASEMVTGDAFKFNTTGSLPITDPQIDTTTNFYLRVIDDQKITVYDDQAHALDTADRATATRQRTANVAYIVTVNPHGFSTNDYVTVSGLGGTGYNTRRVQITVTSPTAFNYANTGTDEVLTADTNGLIGWAPVEVQALGAGDDFAVFEYNATVEVHSSDLVIADSTYLYSGGRCQFTTDGTLPSPLALATDYVFGVVDGKLQIKTTGGVAVAFTDIGTGNHTMNVSSDFTIALETGISVAGNVYENGDAVEFVLGTGATAPSPLIDGTTYYVRRISDDEVELYDTEVNAENVPNTLGRIVLTSLGDGMLYLDQTVANIYVKNIDKIVKSVCNSFIDLYAWDTGRTNALTLIGHYHYDDVEPSYRRIKVGNSCAWLRVRYRRRTFQFRTLDDYLPINNRMAVICMVRSLHLIRNNYIEQAAAYDAAAVKYLLEEQLAASGPDSIAPMVNNDAWMNTTDQYMF